MFKIKKSIIFFLILLIPALFLLNSCKKAECKVTSDCSEKTCASVSCVEKQCKYTSLPNCCGNQVKEPIESGKPGNKCTCPADYGKCEGKGKIAIGTRTYDTQFVERFCSPVKQCLFGIDEKAIRPISLVDERNFGFFQLETTATFNKPFDTGKDSFEFRFVLKDDHEDLIFPVKLTKIILRDGEILFGEQLLNELLNGVGDSVTVRIPTTYILEQLEEQRGLSFKVDYEYKKRVRQQRMPNGSYTYKEELVRDSYENKFRTKIFLIKTGEPGE